MSFRFFSHQANDEVFFFEAAKTIVTDNGERFEGMPAITDWNARAFVGAKGYAKINNVLATMDRGQYCRRAEHYESLAARGGFTVEESRVIPASETSRFVKYLVMVLAPHDEGTQP